jgi:hypothetical protein
MTSKSRVNLDRIKENFVETQLTNTKKVLWATLIVSLFFIANGSMLVYESEFNSGSASTNVGLIVVGSITLFLTFVLLVFLTYASKMTKYVLSIGFLVMIMLGVMFGASVGVLSVVNGVDVPNNSSRNTLGWVFGGITTGIAVISTIVCLVSLWWVYWGADKSKAVLAARNLEVERIVHKLQPDSGPTPDIKREQLRQVVENFEELTSGR